MWENETGAGLLQVMVVGAFLTIAGLLFAQMMVNNDRHSLNQIRRNDNLNIATIIGGYVEDANTVHGASLVIEQIGAGPAITYP